MKSEIFNLIVELEQRKGKLENAVPSQNICGACYDEGQMDVLGDVIHMLKGILYKDTI